MKLSVVIPLFNEEESLNELYERIVLVCNKYKISYEIWFIDDGSTDNSWDRIIEFCKINNKVKAIKFLKNCGKSEALSSAFDRVNGDIVITMDADLQDFPEEIPDLINMIEINNFDLVSGWKKNRFDHKLTKNFPSKLFNFLARKISGIPLHDFNCGLKAYKKQVVKSINFYGDMHRCIPLLVKEFGFSNIGEKIVSHQSRIYGVSKFGKDRFIKAFLDLIILWVIMKFSIRPMYFFGLFGIIMFIIGFFSAIIIGLYKFFIFYYQNKSCLIIDNPWFYIFLGSIILGIQFFVAAFMSEMILRFINIKNNKRSYFIDIIID